ncbi:MAG: thiol-disulfide oxidoreductase DCC family protein [Planctomycetaceae bacterium]|nr:thiol-disulfide oxidoreductase DCC family protein [Planctomycetaceae bacterium]
MSVTAEKTPEEKEQLPDQVIFFDGVCGLCNHFVDFVLKLDRDQVFLFAPIQGETAEKYLKATDLDKMKSIVLMKQGHVFRHTAAVVRVLWGLPGIWKIAGWLLWLVPGPLRDIGYRLVAKFRYHLFGKKDVCRLPSPEERTRFLQ